SPMSVCATITVTAGPDRGKVFELTGEMVRLGTAPDNEVLFSDAQVNEHHASIVRREGRFAIFSSVPQGLQVDGTEIPAERWVWLPEAAWIRVGRRPTVDFTTNGADVASSATEAAEPVGRQSAAVGAASAVAPRPSGSASGSVVLPGARSGTQKGRRSTEIAV